MDDQSRPRRRGALRAACIVAGICLLPAAPIRAQVNPRPPAASPARATFAQLSAQAASAREAGRIDEAIALYRRAVAMRPRWDEGQWYLGSLLYEQGDAAEARAAFQHVLRVHPAHAGAIAMSGLCAFARGDHEQALRELLRSRQLNVRQSPEIATAVRYHTGILLTRFGEFEAGNLVLTELAADAGESPQVIDAFGLNLLRMPMLPGEMPAEARPRVQLAGRAGYAIAVRQLADARRYLESLLAQYPGVPHVHYLWGTFLLKDDPARALAAFREEIARTPGHVPSRLQIAAELVRQGDPGAARPYAEQAVATEPAQLGPRLALGQVMLALGDVAGAIAELERAATLEPASPQAHYLLSVAYARAGRAADAERARAAFTRLGNSATVAK